MNARGLIWLAAAPLALGACSPDTTIEEDVEDRTALEELYVTADTSEGYETNQAAPVTPVQEPTPNGGAGSVDAPLTVTGNLVGIADDAPPGSVVVTEAGPGTQVLLKIDRYTPGTTLVATFVRGRCNAPGEPVARIGTLEVGGQGFATGSFTLPIAARSVLDGTHSVRINTPGQGAPEFTLACANLPDSA